jgi:hypothetical protein
MPNDLAKQLQRIPLFAKLSRDDLKAVAQLAKRAQYPAWSEICRQGTPGQTTYFVESGELRVLRVDPQGIEQEVGRLGPGEYFGETSLMLGESRDATVEVVQDATLLYLNKGDFDQLLEERPWILKALQMRTDVAKKRFARRFRWQDADEVVVVSLHKHNVILARNIFIPCLVLLADVAGCGYWYVQSRSPLALIVGIFLGLFPALLTLYLIMDQYNDDYVVTNKRVVHEERIPFVLESRAEAPLRTVQDIQQTQEGLLAQLCNFGNLIIETAGERVHVIFRQIPDPAQTQEIIFEQIERVLARARAEERAAIRDALHHHFGIPSPETPAPASEPVRPTPRSKLTIPQWVLAPVRLFRYFMPPLRYEEGDTITWRKYWIPLLKPIAPPTLIIILGTLGTMYLIFYHLSNWGPILIAYGVVMAGVFLWWLWIFDNWQNDFYQVTATRIIDVERLPLYLREQRREASLGKVQDISLEIPGVLGNLLNYGSVTIETAGAGALTFDYVKDPRGVQAEIFRRVEAFQAKQSQQEAERRQTELLDWFSVYDQIRNATPPANLPPSSYYQET